MVAIQVRDVPEVVRDVLAAQALTRGQSLQSYLLHLLSAQAAREANPAALERFSGRDDGMTAAVDEVAQAVVASRPATRARARSATVR